MLNLLKNILIGILIIGAGYLAGMVAWLLTFLPVTTIFDFALNPWAIIVSLFGYPAVGIYIAWKIAKKRNMVRPAKVKSADQSSPPENYLPSDSSVTSETSTQGKTNDVTKSKPAQYAAIGCLVVVIAAVALIVTCVVVVLGGSESSDADKAEEKRKGWHCLSAWDGNHSGLEDLVRIVIKDPNSMETIQTRIIPVDVNGNHRITMEFRSRNSFGGMVVNTATGSVDNDTCEATLLGVD